MKKAVFFDLDGTILNTAGDLAAALNEGLKKCGLPGRNQEEVISFLGHGWKRLVELAVPPETSEEVREEVYAVFEESYRRFPDTYTIPYEGIPELLRTLKDRGFKTAVVSNKGDEITQVLIHRFFPGLIDAVLGVTPDRPRKPAPDMAEYVMKKLKVLPEEVLYVGDSRVDYQTAEGAGLDCVLVSWGFENGDRLRELGAPIADTPRALTDMEETQKPVSV